MIKLKKAQLVANERRYLFGAENDLIQREENETE